MKKKNLIIGIAIILGLILFYNLTHRAVSETVDHSIASKISLPENNDIIKDSVTVHKEFTSKTNPSRSLSEKDEHSIPVKYSIMDVDRNSDVIFSAAVRISRKLTDHQLLQLAREVAYQINVKAARGTIGFYLPEMVLNNGSWAAVDFNPAPNVRIIGQSMSDDAAIRANLSNVQDYEGLWADNFKQGAIVTRIRKVPTKGYVIEWVDPADPKPNDLADDLRKTKRNGKIVYVQTDDSGQYYIVENNGNLSVYDRQGFVEAYQKLK